MARKSVLDRSLAEAIEATEKMTKSMEDLILAFHKIDHTLFAGIDKNGWVFSADRLTYICKTCGADYSAYVHNSTTDTIDPALIEAVVNPYVALTTT